MEIVATMSLLPEPQLPERRPMERRMLVTNMSANIPGVVTTTHNYFLKDPHKNLLQYTKNFGRLTKLMVLAQFS